MAKIGKRFNASGGSVLLNAAGWARFQARRASQDCLLDDWFVAELGDVYSSSLASWFEAASSQISGMDNDAGGLRWLLGPCSVREGRDEVTIAIAGMPAPTRAVLDTVFSVDSGL